MAPSATAQSTQTNGDQEMTDAPTAPPQDGRGKYDFLEENLMSFEQKIRVLPGDTPTAASFEIMHEDHTLGNALRWIIMKNPEVEFCGYSIPHPSDPKMNLRIQTYDESTTVYDVLEKGLNDLIALCDIVTDKFEDAQASAMSE